METEDACEEAEEDPRDECEDWAYSYWVLRFTWDMRSGTVVFLLEVEAFAASVSRGACVESG